MRPKIVFLIVIALVMSTLSACGGPKVGAMSEYVTDTEPGAVMTVSEVTPTSAVYQISNETGFELTTGNENIVEIEVEQDGAWHRIEIGEWCATAEAHIIADGSVSEMTANWLNTYGALPTGHYRLLKGFQPEDASGSGFFLSAEFDIK